MVKRELLWAALGGLLGALLGAGLGGAFFFSQAPGPGEGGDKFGFNVVAAGLGGVCAGSFLGGALGSLLGSRLARQSAAPDGTGTRPGEGGPDGGSGQG